MSFNQMLKKIESCIVGIQVIDKTIIHPDDKKEEIPKRGTGFFINENGYAFTCGHVLQSSDPAQNFAIFKDNSGQWSNTKFSVVANNPDVDLAMIKLDVKGKTNFAPVTKSLSGRSVAGLEVGILGFHRAFELGWSFLTHGIISAVIMGDVAKKYLSGAKYLFQIDAIVHGGCSGGPVFLSETEEVIGVLTQHITESGIPTNISFVIPIDQLTVDNILQQISSIK